MLYKRQITHVYFNGRQISAGEEIITDGQNTVRRELLAVHTPDQQIQAFLQPQEGQHQLPAGQQQDGLSSFLSGVESLIRGLMAPPNSR